MQSTVSIIGAGWIGLPLAHNLKTQGKQVRVTTTSPDKAQRLTESGLQAFEVSLSPEPQGAGWEQFLDSEVIVVSIPPKVAQKGADFHPDQMRALLRLVPAHAKVLYTGSSGIFADHGGETVDEDTAPRLVQPRAQALGHAEEVLRQQLGTRLTIVRFGGLMGYDRIPGKMARTKPLRQPGDRVNFVHRDDALGILERVLEKNAWGKLYHAVAPIPATRQAVYAAVAAQGGWPIPSFEDSVPGAGHVVEGKKTQSDLDFAYKYPDPVRFAYDFS